MKYLSRYFFPILLLLITLIICIQNYTPGTWLTGWDTLHPEFNFRLNFERVLFGTWRTDQGLGAVPAHSHMSELPRIILLWISSIFVPLSFLRYLYIFVCFTLGPFGIYIFLKRIILKNAHWSSAAAFLGALFYIFNLGTVQHFYVPFEMFTTQYAALGWLFYFAAAFLEHRNYKHLLAFAITSFFAAPMAYAFLLWYAYAGGLVLYLGSVVLWKRKKVALTSSIILLLVTFATNAFWLLPNWYFIATHAKEVPESQINRLFSDEAFLHNKQYGNLPDSIIFKNFLFNWYEQTGEQLSQPQEVLGVWKDHISNPWILSIGYVVFFISIVGIAVSIKRKSPFAIALLPVSAFALLMIINMNPPFSFVFDYLRDHVSLFREGLRLPWTKFSLLFMFATSVYFGIGILWILQQIEKRIRQNQLAVTSVSVVLFSFVLMWYCKPMFQGSLIDPQMRIKIPEQYFEMFEWFDQQTQEGRVAPLPMHSIWGWEYFDWGFQGAGFTWFGIKFPVLARDFDRWNPVNEAYFREMSAAVYARDIETIEAVAKKYQIGYIVLDTAVLFPKNKPNALWFDETKETLARGQSIRLVQQFGENLSVYQVDRPESISFVQAPSSFSDVGPMMTGGFYDAAFVHQGNYIVNKDPKWWYPARSLVDRFSRISSEHVSVSIVSATLRMPYPVGYTYDPTSNNISLPTHFESLGYDFSFEKEVRLSRTSEELRLTFPLTSLPTFLKDQPILTSDCGGGTPSQRRYVESDYVVFSALNGSSCDYVPFPELKHNYGQLLKIEARNVTGLPLRLCVTNHISRRCDFYTTLDKNSDWDTYIFLLPPFYTDSSGYEVHLNTVSLGNTRSTNEVKSVHMFSIPYHRLQSLAFIDTTKTPVVPNSLSLIETSKINPLLYKSTIQFDSYKQKGLLNLNYANESGWQAFVKTPSFPYFKRITNKVIVNNWANGWVFEPSVISRQQSDCLNAENCKLEAYIVFWPQILELVGLGFLVIVLGLFIKSSIKIT